ncbi:transcriptional regulator TACO1-like protein [Lasiosphaeria miniovina]|uniref:Transcriptional regulator TACO1-like protein n=1 Tax=Lasiosphaeria miniovina TaxID=1954250 RepID=A0AA40DZQ4_9PEZI|nr:transcriptional regulator TACO1-like protein [Lasiosphaeria miniovina]KAK0722554.1 transcriptional regulator TACO1-like protein [Lasiosphaeria miniovina]
MSNLRLSLPLRLVNKRLCAPCRRSFSSTPLLQSGHNKWSKIRHGKAANDAKKTVVRTQFTQTISVYSKLYGANLSDNPQLATAVAAAKKAGVPKLVIENAVARGQGRSSGGNMLEPVTCEYIIPPAIAVIVDCETESKGRVLQDVNNMVKRAGGASSASRFFFTRLGRVVFEKGDTGLDVDNIMDEAIEAGAEDLENNEDGNIIIWTQPMQTTQVCRRIGEKFSLGVLSSEIIWSANEDTRSKLDSSEESTSFIDLLVAIRQYSDVQSIYSNVAKGDMSDEEWARIVENLDV